MLLFLYQEEIWFSDLDEENEEAIIDEIVINDEIYDALCNEEERREENVSSN